MHVGPLPVRFGKIALRISAERGDKRAILRIWQERERKLAGRQQIERLPPDFDNIPVNAVANCRPMTPERLQALCATLRWKMVSVVPSFWQN